MKITRTPEESFQAGRMSTEPTDREKQAARRVAHRAYEKGHRFATEQLELIRRTVGAEMTRQAEDNKNAA